jgi:sterol 14-demethylase
VCFNHIDYSGGKVTGTWILVHLLKSKEWMTKVMEEQTALFGQKNEPLLAPSTLTFDEVQQMTVFEQVFMEVLRLHHPFFQLSRSVKQDSVFNGTVIPKGHFVNVAPSAAMRSSDLFPDGDTFDPSRFAPERKSEIKPYSFIGFGGGLHQCGGRKFAWNSLKASLSWLLRNYEIELIGKGAQEMPKEDYTTSK